MTHKIKIVGGLIGLGLIILLGSLSANRSPNKPATSAITPPVTSVDTSSVAAPETAPAATVSPQPKTPLLVVKEVVDGDTIKVSTDKGTETVRLIGVDTPETKDPRKPVQCFGQEASAKMKEWVEGKAVELESDPTQGDLDKYQRLLRYVFLDGQNINRRLIEEGYGFEYTYNVPYKYQTEFKAAQKSAEAGQKGLWAPAACAGVTKTPTVSTPAAPVPVTVTPKTDTSVAVPTGVAPSTPAPSTNSGVVKKSNSSICHAPGTTYYDQTKNFTPYNSLQECLDSGGRLPKR